MQKLSRERMRPIRDEVHDTIRKAIIRRKYAPGERLQEEALAAELGVSRTPVREALRKLEVDGLVTYYPHKGSVVAGVSLDEVEDLYRVRLVLEVLIVRRAAERANADDIVRLLRILDEEQRCEDPDDILDAVEKFNAALFEVAAAHSLAKLNQSIRETLQQVMISNHLNPVRRKEAHSEHLRIVEALAANDPDLAEKYTVEHLNHSPRTGSTTS